MTIARHAPNRWKEYWDFAYDHVDVVVVSCLIFVLVYMILYWGTSSVGTSLSTDDVSLTRLRLSWAFGCDLFVLGIPFYKSRKSFFDAIAAKHVLTILRVAILLFLACDCITLYFFLVKGGT